MAASQKLAHVVIFPLMAKGHTIPLLDLACLLRRRGLAAVTLFTTPENAAFVRAALAKGGAGDAAVVELPFPDGRGQGDRAAAAGGGVADAESGSSSFAALAESTPLLRPGFEAALASMRPRAGLLVADAFLHWAHASAAALGVPRRLAFVGDPALAHIVWVSCVRGAETAATPPPEADTFTVPELPHLQFRFAEFAPLPASFLELHAKAVAAIAGCHGMIMNTFHDLEGRYVEQWDRHIGPKAWPVGPLCLARKTSSAESDSAHAKPSWMQWLDAKAAAGRAVLYIAVGTLAVLPEVQMKEIADGLDQSGVDFLWVIRQNDVDLGVGFHERVHGRGKVVCEWVDQLEILRHTSVRGFLTHGGWNSVLESITAGVPMAVMPIEFEQPLNAKLVVEELGIGIRIHTSDGAISSLVKSEEVARVVRELMFGEEGVTLSMNAAAKGAQARLAMSEGGSSWKTLEEMVTGLCVATIAETEKTMRDNCYKAWSMGSSVICWEAIEKQVFNQCASEVQIS